MFDFLKGVRSRAHWVVFTGINDTVYHALKDNLSTSLMNWLDGNYFNLIRLGEDNRKTIKDQAKGKVVATNGYNTF